MYVSMKTEYIAMSMKRPDIFSGAPSMPLRSVVLADEHLHILKLPWLWPRIAA